MGLFPELMTRLCIVEKLLNEKLIDHRFHQR